MAGLQQSSLSTRSVTQAVAEPFSWDSVMTVHDGQYADLDALSGLSEKVDRHGRLVVSGYLDRVRVTVNERGTVVVGSLPGYLHGTNAVALSLADTRLALESIADRLGLSDPGAGVVTQLAIGAHLFTVHPAAQYARLLLGAGRVDARPLGPASVVVGRKPHQDAVYGKIEELRASGVPVPAAWEGRHVVRYETRSFKRVACAYGGAVLASDLWTPALHERAVRRAVARFDRLVFARALGPVPTRSVRDLDRYLHAAGVEAAGGGVALLRLVADTPKPTAADRQAASRVRTRIRARATDPVAGDDLGAELRAAVHEAARLSLFPTT